MPNILQTLTQLLQKDPRLVVDGNLTKNKIIELTIQLDAGILKLLKSSPEMRKIFFVEVESDDYHPEKQTIEKNGQFLVYPIDSKSVERIKDNLRAKKTEAGYKIELGKDFQTLRT